MAGRKIIHALQDAVDGNLACVTIDGVVWVRKDLARVAELEEALRDLCDRCTTWPNPGDSEALLRAKALLE